MTRAAIPPAPATAPLWRRQPYRLFFPLGLALAWCGVVHWLLHGLGVLPDYRPVFHAITQIQGFLMAFAVGFLFTAIPRRTGTAPPSAWQVGVAAASPVVVTVAAWYERWAITQAAWIALVVVLAGFAVTRFRAAGARRRPPNSFVWIPLSLATGVVGSALIGAFGILGEEYYGLHELGRSLLLQGMFVGLVAGVGGLVLPLVTRGQGPADGTASARDRGARLLHAAAAVALAGTFWIEHDVSLRWGLALRALLVLAVLLAGAGILRRPTEPGWHRRLIWLAAWALPAGYALAAAFPAQKKAGLHVVFIGGLALMALSVGLHVTLAHGGYAGLVRGRPWQVPIFGGLLAAATVLRALVDFDPTRFFPWIAAAAAAFLGGTLAWASLVLPRIWAPDPESSPDP